MNIFFKFSLLFAFVSFISWPIAAQAPIEEDDQCNDDQVKLLATQLVEESRSVPEVGKKIKVWVRSADFLWPIDKATARTYYADAYKFAVDNHREKGVERTETKTANFTFVTAERDFRFEVVSAIAKNDSQWARKLTDELMAEFEKTLKDKKEGEFKREMGLMLQIAYESLDTNRDLSLYIYRRMMKLPLEHDWFFTLYQIAGKDEAFASNIYVELIQTYQNESARKLLFLSAYPFSRERIFGVEKYQYGTTLPSGLTPRTDLQRPFLELFFNRVAYVAADPAQRSAPSTSFINPEPVQMIAALGEMESYVIQDHPSLMLQFSRAKANAQAMMTPEMFERLQKAKAQAEMNELTFEERLARLEKADEEGKLGDNMIISLIIMINKTDAQFEQLKAWLDKIQEKPAREASISYYWYARAKLAIKETRFADSEAHAAKVPELEYQATLAFDLADAKLESITDAPTVYQTLNEVAKLARRMEDSPAKAKVLLGLAYQYEKIDHGFALEELGEAVRVINNLKDPDLFSAAQQRMIVGKTFAFYTSYSIPGFDPENTFRELSINDFGLALSNARSINDRVIRSVAVLAVAKNCVERRKRKKSQAAQSN